MCGNATESCESGGIGYRNLGACSHFSTEQSEFVECYVRNDHLGLGIPYEHDGISHLYEPDFIVRLKNGVHLVLEIKGFEPDQVYAKHAAAKRWVSAVNNWGKLKKWDFLVCRDPQLLGQELDKLTADR